VAVQTMQRVPTADPAPARRPGRDLTGLWFALPFLAVYAIFLLWPIAAGLFSSFSNASLAGGQTEFLGLDNYAEMVRDDAVWTSLWHTLLFTLFSTPPLVLLGLAMALLAHRARRTGWLLRFAFFLPFLLPVTVVTLIWIWLYQPDFGLINDALGRFGVEPMSWIGDERTAMLAVVATTVWWTVGFNFLLYLAALQGIPRELYESAEIDGSSGWQRLRYLTVPLLRRTTGLVLVLQLIASLKVFDQIYLLNQGGTNLATRPIIQYIYEQGFTSYRIGFASAISYLFFLIVVVIAFAQFKLFPSGKEETP
jgi:multiple sugar transport system permease protein